MYGDYEPPFSIKENKLSVEVEKIEKLWTYRRTLEPDTVEKFILGDGKHIIINPVEPLNTPKEITTNLLIEFEKVLLLAGGAKKKIFLTFPIEIGIFIADKGNKNIQLLDVFTLASQKFTLYGPVSNGVVCKHWKSRIYSVPPSINPLIEGVMELTLRNTTSDWASITKAVFSAYGMKLYYNIDVFMKARMNIRSKSTADTDFELRHISGELKSDSENNQNPRKEAIGIYNKKLEFVPLNFDMGLGF
jgi:hypothetical protein